MAAVTLRDKMISAIEVRVHMTPSRPCAQFSSGGRGSGGAMNGGPIGGSPGGGADKSIGETAHDNKNPRLKPRDPSDVEDNDEPLPGICQFLFRDVFLEVSIFFGVSGSGFLLSWFARPDVTPHLETPVRALALSPGASLAASKRTLDLLQVACLNPGGGDSGKLAVRSRGLSTSGIAGKQFPGTSGVRRDLTAP